METFSWYPRMLILDVVDQIDLYYLHRYVPILSRSAPLYSYIKTCLFSPDPQVPIEISVAAMAELVK